VPPPVTVIALLYFYMELQIYDEMIKGQGVAGSSFFPTHQSFRFDNNIWYVWETFDMPAVPLPPFNLEAEFSLRCQRHSASSRTFLPRSALFASHLGVVPRVVPSV
jgi:hypothetical protein